MIEVIALFFLCRLNGRLAAQKGLKVSTWQVNTVLAWVVAEIAGVLLGLSLFGKDNLEALALLGLVSAFGGYLYVKYLLENKPDELEDEVNKVGIDDLRPPRKG